MGSQEQSFFLQTLLFTPFVATVPKIITYALVSTWSWVSSGWEHVTQFMHHWIFIWPYDDDDPPPLISLHAVSRHGLLQIDDWSYDDDHHMMMIVMWSYDDDDPPPLLSIHAMSRLGLQIDGYWGSVSTRPVAIWCILGSRKYNFLFFYPFL